MVRLKQRKFNTNHVLVVDVSGYPKDIIYWKQAICHLLDDIAYTVETYRDADGNEVYINSPSTRIAKPAIIALNKYYPKSYGLRVSASKVNIFLRDNYTCQYTGKKLTDETANIDHVVPKSKGGKWCWTNLVTCDKGLNTLKEDRTPDECGLRLLKPPFKPSRELILRRKVMYSGNDTWVNYFKHMDIS